MAVRIGGYVMMKKIAVIPNTSKDSDFAVTKRLTDCLFGKAQIYMRAGLGLSDERVCYTSENIPDCCDIAIVIGGDGTIINAAGECSRKNIPILGVNLGRVGFMSELEVTELESGIERLLSGSYITENRMMIKLEVTAENGEIKKAHALNDVVIQKTDGAKLIGLDLYSGGEKISRYISDGLIISTPTGSTGYNFSAGGPVVNPLMSLFVATAICPHMLTSRPAVLPSDIPVCIKSNKTPNCCGEVVVDGVGLCRIDDSSEIKITQSKYTTRLIKIVKRSFYDTLIQKLS